MAEKKLFKIKERLQDIYNDRIRLATIILVFLSIIFFVTMLIGGSTGTVYLNKFTFEEGISKLLSRKSIKFTMLGYCIDDKCTKDVSHDFDKAPTSDEIQSGEVKKRSINIHKYVTRDFNPDDIANDAKKKAEDTVDDAKNVNVGDTIDKVGDKASEIGNKASDAIEQLAKEALNKLLEAFDNFKPKETTGGISGWISKPIIAAMVFNFVALIILFSLNPNNATLLYFLTTVLLFISIILNLASLITTSMLFSLAFSIIGAFPGIGDNDTGAANGLSICSLLCLISALMITIARGCGNFGNKRINKNDVTKNETIV